MALDLLNKKQKIVYAAIHLFARQGYDGTTTAQIAEKAAVTEPLICYHFGGKNELFALILAHIFDELMDRFDSLKKETSTEFEKIRGFIDVHFQFMEEMPEEMALLLSACPAKLKDSRYVCFESIKDLINWGISYLSQCLKSGIKKGEFYKVPIKQTANMMVAMMHGLLRQKEFDEETGAVVRRDTVVMFFKQGLVKR